MQRMATPRGQTRIVRLVWEAETPIVRLVLTRPSPRPFGQRCWDARWLAPAYARPTHRSLRERFFRRMLNNSAGCAILSTAADRNTTFVWRTCSQSDRPCLPKPAATKVDDDCVGLYHCIAR